MIFITQKTNREGEMLRQPLGAPDYICNLKWVIWLKF